MRESQQQAMKTTDRTSFIMAMIEVVYVCSEWEAVRSLMLWSEYSVWEGYIHPMGNDSFDSYKGI